MEEKRWTTAELAREAGLVSSHVRRLLIEGKIKGVKFGHIWAIPDGEVQRFLESRAHGKTSDSDM